MLRTKASLQETRVTGSRRDGEDLTIKPRITLIAARLDRIRERADGRKGSRNRKTSIGSDATVAEACDARGYY